MIDLTGGKGYIEKDWGRSLPDAWIWMQSNNFD
ncbi:MULTISPECIES: tocopherol cyclase family protein [unclassified Mesotoga]|nr:MULTISPECIES: tocopherol cyclase family protein [unclassified Mesotoga]